ncbi:hypothetical protein L6452_31226 [Arctium lappa]|uniref:Uncharacterized protein n=1 Tax=Arctium lappa TaxID=4217 RepID=A0ACB8ZJG4_ARCLA|nr:hypothetical protein L6452_31226 [Arctium lappa]
MMPSLFFLPFTIFFEASRTSRRPPVKSGYIGALVHDEVDESRDCVHEIWVKSGCIVAFHDEVDEIWVHRFPSSSSSSQLPQPHGSMPSCFLKITIPIHVLI